MKTLLEKAIAADKENFISNWLKENKEPIDADTAYDDMLDEVSGPVRIGSLEYSASRVLAEIDPTAYRCGFSNWLDAENFAEVDGDYYTSGDYDEAEEAYDEAVEAEEEEAERLAELNGEVDDVE